MNRRLFLLSSVASSAALAGQAKAPAALSRVVHGDVGYMGRKDPYSIHAFALSIFDYRAENGRDDVWQTAKEIKAQIDATGRFYGDCEDFATYCVCAGGFQYAMCLTEKLEPHVVALSGDIVLCNRLKEPAFASDLAYQWIKRSTPNGWVSGAP